MTQNLLPVSPRLEWDASAVDIEAAMETIDAEIMKRGTLGAESINWEQVRSSAAEVLTQCAELTAVRAFSLAEEQRDAPSSFDEIVSLLQRLFDIYWDDAIPTSVRRRSAWASDILALLERITRQCAMQYGPLKPQQIKCLTALLLSFEAHSFDVSAARVALDDAAKPVEREATTDDVDPLGSNLKLDAAGRAKLRRDIRAISDRIASHDPEAPVAFSLRAYAAWLEHQGAPPADDQGKINQYPMPSGIVQQMKDQLKSPSPSGLQAIEDRLFDNPDWFEGHKIAAEMASGLGLVAVSNSIRDRVVERLSSLPELQDLTFANGLPMVSDEIQEWVSEPTRLSAEGEVEQPQSITLEAALQSVENTSKALAGSRAKAIARFRLARILLTHGFAGQASLLLGELNQLLSAPLPDDWEQDLRREISMLISEVGRSSEVGQG